jgi:hypothetical protein
MVFGSGYRGVSENGGRGDWLEGSELAWVGIKRKKARGRRRMKSSARRNAAKNI